MRHFPWMLSVLWFVLAGDGLAAGLEWVRVAKDNQSFVLDESGQQFVAWGFNYDHDRDGRLLEEYWDAQWPTVEEDFREMKRLGANVVRIHLQFAAFMASPTEPRQHSLDQLARLVRLAERTGLYLDLTGLGCYHKLEVPPWYNQLSEEARWNAQARFWEAVARRCAGSPAIFCYDLMNEPVVPGGKKERDDWLGPPFAGKHFVQFISLAVKGRVRHEIARQWISRLVAAIRKHDRRHLVTVGLVPWSLNRPGMTSGFDPAQVTDDLDFIAFHVYPEKGKVGEALETLKGFAAIGKPVVIEELFPLKCGAGELGQFIDESRSAASGWIGFYWGKTPDEYRTGDTFRDGLVLSWLELFQEKNCHKPPRSLFGDVDCQGVYRHHLQGVCTNEKDALYWSFTTTLVKTDPRGKVLKQVSVENHHGDLCHHDGKLYVAVNLGRFNDPQGHADSWVYVYQAGDLTFVAKHQTPEVFHGAGGMAHDGKRFIVIGGLPEKVNVNYAYQYDSNFQFVKKYVIHSGYTRLGIQTAAFAEGHWWFGCYGNELLKTDESFKLLGKYDFDCGLGIVSGQQGQFLIARGTGKDGDRTGSLLVAHPDAEKGLVVERQEPKR